MPSGENTCVWKASFVQGAQTQSSMTTWRGGVGMGSGREVQEGGAICLPTADSGCCAAESSTMLLRQGRSNEK